MIVRKVLGFIAAIVLTSAAGASFAEGAQTSETFSGKVVNAGTVTHTTEAGREILRLSADFVVPTKPPAPTWRVVDTQGNIYTLDALRVKAGNGEKREVVLPAYIHDVAKVQFYCAFVEVVLGEAAFSPAATLGSKM